MAYMEKIQVRDIRTEKRMPLYDILLSNEIECSNSMPNEHDFIASDPDKKNNRTYSFANCLFLIYSYLEKFCPNKKFDYINNYSGTNELLGHTKNLVGNDNGIDFGDHARSTIFGEVAPIKETEPNKIRAAASKAANNDLEIQNFILNHGGQTLYNLFNKSLLEDYEWPLAKPGAILTTSNATVHWYCCNVGDTQETHAKVSHIVWCIDLAYADKNKMLAAKKSKSGRGLAIMSIDEISTSMANKTLVPVMVAEYTLRLSKQSDGLYLDVIDWVQRSNTNNFVAKPELMNRAVSLTY